MKTVAQCPSSNTLYEKRGKKYVPVAEYFTVDYWRKGNYLVQVLPGSRSITQIVWPRGVPEVEAALKSVADGVLAAMRKKANTPKSPTPESLTPKQKRALKMWSEAFGDRSYVLFPSQQEIVDAGLDELRKALNDVRSG